MQITVDLASQLVAEQFPEYSHLDIEPVANSGWDNRTFHLGSQLSIRIPSGPAYVAAIAKEQEWLPKLAPLLPLPIPRPVASGQPGTTLPWPWTINAWLPGEVASKQSVNDGEQFAVDLAHFLRSLQQVSTRGGPVPDNSNIRGGSMHVLEKSCLLAIKKLSEANKSGFKPAKARAIWEAARASSWTVPPVWVHGDVAAGNLLVRDGRLSAVIDFGQLVVGDPACDLAIAWTFLDAASRQRYQGQLGIDDATWQRGQGWAMWKALIVHAGIIQSNALETAAAPRVLRELGVM